MCSDAAEGKNTIHYIPDLIKRLPANAASRIPEWMEFTTSVSDRVARLKALDDVAPLLFRKRELSAQLKKGAVTNAQQANAFGEWLACVKALSENVAVRDEKREKYREIIKFTKGVTMATAPKFTLADKLRLRAEALGSKRYKMNAVSNSQKRTGNWYTNGQRIAQMQQNLQSLMKSGGGSVTRNKLGPFKAWANRLRGLPIGATAKASVSYQRLVKMANNFGSVLGTRPKVGPANNYEAQILGANNGRAIMNVISKIRGNSKLSANRKAALARLGLQRNAQLTQAALNLARQRAGVAANQGGAGPAPRGNNGGARRQASPPKSKSAAKGNNGGARRQASPSKPKVNNSAATMNALRRAAVMDAKALNAGLKSLGVTPAQLKTMNRSAKVNAYVSKSVGAR